MTTSRKDRLQGILVSLPTFNDKNFNLRLDQSKKHIRWLIDQGIVEGSGVLMIAGGLGEGYFLDDDEWHGMAQTVAEAADGKVPTMIGLFELSAREAAKKARYAADAGVDFVQVAPPHYMLPSEDDVFGHFKHVNDAADIGIVAYNTPWAMPRPGFEYSQGMFERFLSLDNFDGIKWNSGDIRHFVRILRLYADKLSFFENMGAVLMSFTHKLGMRGFVDFQSNVAPRLSLERWKLLSEKRYDEFDELELRTKIDPFVKVINPEEEAWVGMGEGPTSRIRLSSLGLETGPEFPAQAPLSEGYVRGFMRAVEASGVREWVDWDQSILDD